MPCCAFNNEHRHKHAKAAKTAPSKQEEPCEKDVDALTFMQTVIMSFARGMTHGEQTLPINDLFVYLPVQLVPALVEAIGKRGYERAEVKGGWGYRPRKEGAEDNPLLVAGVYSKNVAYDRDPQMPDTSWAERAYTHGALDPSLGQSMSFPSLPQLKLRVEVPLWRDFAEARHPPSEPHSEESDADSDVTGVREPSPRYAQPVPVGTADPLDTADQESIEEEEAMEEPTYTCAQGYGRFAIRYTRLATALGNFDQGNAQAESAVVAGWLTSGLEIAMYRMGWSLLSPRKTRLNYQILKRTTTTAIPPDQQYGNVTCTDDQWDRLCVWLTGDPTFRSKIERRKKELKEKVGGKRDDSDDRTKARRIAPPLRERSSSSTARFYHRNWPPSRLRLEGGGSEERSH